jgi:hypothetical protein
MNRKIFAEEKKCKLYTFGQLTYMNINSLRCKVECKVSVNPFTHLL